MLVKKTQEQIQAQDKLDQIKIDLNFKTESGLIKGLRAAAKSEEDEEQQAIAVKTLKKVIELKKTANRLSAKKAVLEESNPFSDLLKEHIPAVSAAQEQPICSILFSINNKKLTIGELSNVLQSAMIDLKNKFKGGNYDEYLQAATALTNQFVELMQKNVIVEPNWSKFVSDSFADQNNGKNNLLSVPTHPNLPEKYSK